MPPYASILAAVLAGLSLACADEPVARSIFTEVADGTFGDNPSGTKMFLYVPEVLAAPPPVVVGIHWCHGSATAYYQGTQWSALAEEHGFIVIYPETPFIDEDACWDVASVEALTHNGGGDSNSIANMVEFVLGEYNADSSRVFVTGISSGAMMTNVMVAAYPNLFTAGVIYSGVPPTCFMSADNIPDYWNGTCAEGGVVADQSYWVGKVHGMYPGYSGPYPKLQVYHGDSDEILNFTNYGESIKLWTGIFGYDNTPDEVLENDPVSPFTKYIYGDRLQGIVGGGVPHNIPHDETEDLKFFGLDADTPATSSTTSSPIVSSTTTSSVITTDPPTSTMATSTVTSTTSASEATQSHWGQCGGNSYTGPTACESPYTCTYFNDWYSQCL